MFYYEASLFQRKECQVAWLTMWQVQVANENCELLPFSLCNIVHLYACAYTVRLVLHFNCLPSFPEVYPMPGDALSSVSVSVFVCFFMEGGPDAMTKAPGPQKGTVCPVGSCMKEPGSLDE